MKSYLHVVTYDYDETTNHIKDFENTRFNHRTSDNNLINIMVNVHLYDVNLAKQITIHLLSYIQFLDNFYLKTIRMIKYKNDSAKK